MSLFSAMSISATGLAAQRLRAEVITQNIANAETTRTAEGGPYRRRDVVFEAAGADTFDAVLSAAGTEAGGVRVSEIRSDDREAPKRYLPGHPDADKNGFVSFPRVNPAEDMVDLMSAARGYGANISAVAAVRDMISKSLELLR